MKRGRLGIWLRGAVALGALVGAVSLPIEVSFDTAEPMTPIHPSASLLLASSCLLLIGSSLTLRRDEAARQLALRQDRGA